MNTFDYQIIVNKWQSDKIKNAINLNRKKGGGGWQKLPPLAHIG
jgi:hypothetical protein